MPDMRSQRTVQCEGVDVLAVVGPCHVLLAKANGVLALGNAIELFQSRLIDTLKRGCCQ